ncbi:MAG: winged helix-turn-helix transcriptional regulator [Promethearchaeota archaeon]
MSDEDSETFAELIDLFPQIIHTSNQCINRELQNFSHTKSRIDLERQDIRQIVSIIQGKWTLEILYIVRQQDEINFNEIKKLLSKISSTILTERLKKLEEMRLIKRAIIDVRPLRVLYSLTNFGSNFVHLMLPVFIYSLSEMNKIEKEK